MTDGRQGRDDFLKRCGWATDDPLYVRYHDLEWGVPLHDDAKLFEMLLLEGVQAGLSWLTVLKRRENYRIAYDDFDPKKIAAWDSEKIEQLLADPGIIRNRLKIEAARGNARAFLQITAEFKSFDAFIPFRYSEEDRKRAYYEAKNRKGEMERFPLLSISIAVVINHNGNDTLHVGQAQSFGWNKAPATPAYAGLEPVSAPITQYKILEGERHGH